jgi:hypothetical protein
MSKLIRRTHLLTALFLTPWITMYALSTLVMHHRELFTGHERRVAPEYDVVRDGTYELDEAANESPELVAKRILSHLGLTGAHTVRRDSSGTLTIQRDRPMGAYRVTWDAKTNRLRVERQRFGTAFFLEMLHRRSGFRQDYLANTLWALSVDAVIAAIVLWAATGIWMWAGMPTTRMLGSLCLVGGSALFCFLLFIL